MLSRNTQTDNTQREEILTSAIQIQRSCNTNILSFNSRVLEVVQERDGSTDCIYLDLKKTLDKAPHEILINQLVNSGICQEEHYLTHTNTPSYESTSLGLILVWGVVCSQPTCSSSFSDWSINGCQGILERVNFFN